MTIYDQIIGRVDEKYKDQHFLSVKDIADYIEVTPRTVTNLIGRKELFALKVGREFRIPRDAFKVYLENAKK